MPVGESQPPEADPLIGRVLSDRYRILRKLGEGGMGVVYQAEHALIGKKVALKILFPELTRRTELVARFLQEARSASRIAHENVIDISDFGQSPDGLVYIAMEYLDGQDLGQVLRQEGPMPWQRARSILLQMGKALRAAHEQGIIHRDMKPENIFVIQREGHPDFVKVLDFGIAKVVNLDEGGPRLTQTGMIFGTPEYMSPEQAQGQTPDHRVDIYAVGCIMYHLLTGQVPFVADSFMGILTKQMLEPIVPPRRRRPDLDIPEDVEAVVLRALEKDRAARWDDMTAFCRALGRCGGEAYDLSGPYAKGSGPNVAPPLPPAASEPVAAKAAAVPAPEPARGGRPSTEILPVPGTREIPAPRAARSSRPLFIGVVAVAAVLIVIVAGIAFIRAPRSGSAGAVSGGASVPAGGGVGGASSSPGAAPTAPPPSQAPAAAPGGDDRAQPSPSPAATVGVAAPPPRPARPRQRTSGEAVRAITDGVGATGKTERPRPSTPAELKDPFNNL